MNLIASRHHKRSIGFAMLFVWVFALLSGVANACLTEPRGEARQVSPHASQMDHPARAALHPHMADQARHDEKPDHSLCQMSCDESWQTLLKQLPKLDTPDQHALIAPIHGQPSDLHMAPAGVARAALAAIPPLSPPRRVLFSRLAR